MPSFLLWLLPAVVIIATSYRSAYGVVLVCPTVEDEEEEEGKRKRTELVYLHLPLALL